MSLYKVNPANVQNVTTIILHVITILLSIILLSTILLSTIQYYILLLLLSHNIINVRYITTLSVYCHYYIKIMRTGNI